MSSPILGGWVREPDPVDETEFTPWGTEGWMAWNGQSPEVEVCVFTAMLTSMLKPRLVIETGVGQGYMTRFLVDRLSEGQKLIAFESNTRWRTEMWNLPFWNEHAAVAVLSSHSTPLPDQLAAADLCVFDSDFEVRFDEVRMWDKYAKPDAVAIIHDTSDQPDTIHASLHDLIWELDMNGVFLKNPRGCFMAVQGNKEE